MTIIEAIPSSLAIPRRPAGTRPRGTAIRRAPGPVRPPGAPPRFASRGVVISRRPQPRRPVTPATTVGLALLAGLITGWLGLVAHFGATARDVAPSMPSQLAVVEVQDGETLQRLAARVAPDVPASQVVDRIRDLNNLDSAALQAGQTLITPIG